jgi:hypothetical protein
MSTTTTKFLQLVKNPYSPFMEHLLAHQLPFLQVIMLVAKGIIDANYDEHLQVMVLLIFTFKKPKHNMDVLVATNCSVCKTYFT